MESKLRVLVFLLVTLTSVDLGYCETVKRRPALLFKRDAKEIGEFETFHVVKFHCYLPFVSNKRGECSKECQFSRNKKYYIFILHI